MTYDLHALISVFKHAYSRLLNRALIILIRPYDLHELIWENEVDALKEAIENGADINMQDADGSTPLLAALLSNRNQVKDEIIECLLNYNPDITIANKYGTVPLNVAVMDHQIKFVKALIARGAEINSQEKQYILLVLSVRSDREGRYDMEVTNYLLENGADINARGKYDQTILHDAVKLYFHRKKNILTLIEYLLQNGADINAQDSDGVTPFMIAVCTHDEPFIALLLRYSPDVTIKGNEARTAVRYLSSRSDLSNSIKGMILLRSVPGLRRWRLESFINAFRMQSPFPGELYNAITLEFIALVHPEIPLEMKVRWLKTYDEEVLGIGKEQVCEAEEQALTYETRCRR
jgi:hypothetical protein